LGDPVRDDRELVQLANRGDPAGLEGLYRAHGEWVAALARRFVGDPDEALDVMHEVFAYLFERFPGFELRSTMRAFLYPVVRHQSISLIRKRRKVVEIDRGSRPPAELTFWPDEQGDLSRLIDGLDEDSQELLLMRFTLGMKLSEIAEALSVPTGTVKSRLHNALKELRRRHGNGPEHRS
jgi:RNA polymerase sigma-70 factor (ECF subfamily)